MNTTLETTVVFPNISSRNNNALYTHCLHGPLKGGTTWPVLMSSHEGPGALRWSGRGQWWSVPLGSSSCPCIHDTSPRPTSHHLTLNLMQSAGLTLQPRDALSVRIPVLHPQDRLCPHGPPWPQTLSICFSGNHGPEILKTLELDNRLGKMGSTTVLPRQHHALVSKLTHSLAAPAWQRRN